MIEATSQRSRDAAMAELSHLNQCIDRAYMTLVRTLVDLQDAQVRLSEQPMQHLREANERLVLSALQLQRDAEHAAVALCEATRSGELDPLTLLPNRALLADRLAQAIGAGKRHGGKRAVLFMDLDHFKARNDAFGHAAGDLILVEVGRRLTACVRETDTVCRLGGDEFVILLVDVSQRGDPVVVARKMLAAVRSPMEVDGQSMAITASIGIGLYPDDGTDAPTLLAAADGAMYRAKHAGGNGCCLAHAGESPATSPPTQRATHGVTGRNPVEAQQLRQPMLPIHASSDAEPSALPTLWGPL